MTALARKVFALFGKPELATEPPLPATGNGEAEQPKAVPTKPVLLSAARADSAAKFSPAKAFPSLPLLPSPLGQEENPDVWDTWTPLFDWLIEHHPDHFHAVCDAEDTLNRMEREGITSGEAYEAACSTLFVRFEAARRLKLVAKVWIQ